MTNPPRFIFLNGPGRAGKDSIAAVLQNLHGYWDLKLAAPLYDMLSLFDSEASECMSGELGDIKTKPVELIPSVTRRKFLIDAGSFLHNYDPEILGKLLLTEVAKYGNDSWRFSISDVRLPQNLTAIFRTIPAADCLLIRVHREGCSFETDVGGYIQDVEVPCKCVDVENNTTLSDLARKISAIVLSY